MSEQDQNQRKGLLFILSGPSGVGKDTLIDKWLEANRSLARVVTCTTREPRPGERLGVDYHFVSEDEFKRLVDEDAFLEHKSVYNYHYGTLTRELARIQEQGKDAILKIDVQGAIEAKAKRPDAILIFVQPPSMKELEQRLTKRLTDKPEQIQIRLQTAHQELDKIPHYHYLITNDLIERATRTLQSILNAEHSRVGRVSPIE